jgi:hypothetical protein
MVLAEESNLMKFDMPLSPAADLEMECDHAEADPGTVTLGAAGADCSWHGESATWHGESATTTVSGAPKFGPGAKL